MQIVPEIAKSYRRGDPLSAADLRPRAVNDRSRREVCALAAYFEGLRLSADDRVVAELAAHRTRVLMAAMYERTGGSAPFTAREWLRAVHRLQKERDDAQRRQDDLDAEASARSRSQKPRGWRMGRSPGSYDPR